ncbi:Coq4 family protein [Nostoc sp.]|uniref:Coq4 family protein n=1 Tax=Nostoc sp. TaxID=1180 RepID=UPI002FF74255
MDKDLFILPSYKVGKDLTHQMRTISALQPFLAMLAGDSSLDVVGEMAVALLKTPSFDIAVEHLKGDPGSAALIEERYMALPHDLHTLLQYPPDSLGYLYSMAMKAKGFRAEDLYEKIPIYSDASYVEARLGQTHDIWHIVTGFGVSPAEEIGLQAFHLPQFPYPLAVSLLSSSMMSTLLFNPEELPTLLNAIQTGWEMGKNAKSLFAQKWESAWEKPLLQWQKELNLLLY